MPRGSQDVLMSALGRALAALVVPVAVLLPAEPAWAACHAFTVAVSPAVVDEGGTVTVTVRRDGDVAPSNVDVSTVDETARSGSDYPAVRRTVAFSSGVEQSFPLPTTEDQVRESSETFRLHLSDPGGCSVNTDFQLGPDAQVTIRDDDAAPASPTARPTTAAPRPSPTPVRTTPAATRTTASARTPTSARPPATSAAPRPPSTRAAASGTPSVIPSSAAVVPPSPVPTPSGSTPGDSVAQQSDDDGLPAAVIAGLAVGTAAVLAAAVHLGRRRRLTRG